MRIVGGKHKGRRLVVPRGRETRPTTDRTREALFNILGHADFARGAPDAMTVLDVFAGSGALGLEALSRGAARAVFLEHEATAVRVIAQNARDLGEQARVTVLRRDAARPGRPPATGPFGLVFMDAPYGADLTVPALLALTAAGWLADGAIVVVELPAGTAFAAPDGFVEHDRRLYGAAQLVFLARLG